MNPIVIIVRWITAAALLSCSGQALGQVYGEVHLKNGTVRKGQLSGVDENGTKLLVQGGAGTVITFAHRQVAKVVFPAPADFRAGMEAYREQEYARAARLFERVAKNRRPGSTFYPAPGNYSALADRRLLECYQRTENLEALAPVLKRLDWSHLPPEEQRGRGMFPLWGALGRGDIDRALREIDERQGSLSSMDSSFGELSYVKGYALELDGRSGEALVAYGEVVGLFPGANRALASKAVQRSCLLLDAAGRISERDAYLDHYRRCYGDGELWNDAPAGWSP